MVKNSLESGSRGRWTSEFEACLVYMVSFITARAIEKLSKQNKKKASKQARKSMMKGIISYLPLESVT